MREWLEKRPSARPLGSEHWGLALLLSLLRWGPRSRATMTQTLARLAAAEVPTAASPQAPAGSIGAGESRSREAEAPGQVHGEGAAPVHDGSDPRPRKQEPTCRCVGNCCRKVCAKKANMRRRSCCGTLVYHGDKVVCDAAPADSFALCPGCKCEEKSCTRLRKKGGHRWCATHDRTFKAVKPSTHFITRKGARKYPPDFTLAEKVVARCSFVLAFLMPLDIVMFCRFCRATSPSIQAGSPISHTFLALSFFAHAIKWPPAVEYFLQAVHKVEASRVYVRT